MSGRARGRGFTKVQPGPGDQAELTPPGRGRRENTIVPGPPSLHGQPEPTHRPCGRGMPRGGGQENELKLLVSNLQIKSEPQRSEPYTHYIEPEWKKTEKNSIGISGEKVTLYTNYFDVNLHTDCHIFQYHVAFKPPVENVRVKFGLLGTLGDILGSVKVFDGGILYLQKLLPKDPLECVAERSYDGAPITVQFKYVTEIKANSPQFLQMVNLMFKRVQIALDMKQIRDHYFNIHLSTKIPKHKIEVMPGFTTSILKYDGGNLLCVDTIHKVLRIDTYLDALYQLYQSVNKNPEEFRRRATKELVGVIVLTKHNNKTYKVDDIAWEQRASDIFMKNGQQISFKQYYKEHWNITINDENQPLLVSRPTERDVRRGDNKNLFLIPELCIITGLSDQMRADFNVMRDLAVHTRIGPGDRLQQLHKLLDQVNDSPKVQEILTPWQIGFSNKACEVPGRQLQAENLLMGKGNKISYNIREAEWSRGMRSVELLYPIQLEKWLIVFPRANSQHAHQLSDSLTQVGRNMKMYIAEAKQIEINDDRNDTYLQAIRQTLEGNTQMVLCIVPNQKKDRYDAIKKCCCIDNPVPSQVVAAKTLQKKEGLVSVATKIALQLNCKMGGEVWGAEIPLKGLMVVGIDTYHDSAHKNQSVGALVASLNKQCTRYFSKTEYHPTKDEFMRNLQPLMSAALKKFHEVNGALPLKIVLFRDGVGDGQLPTVFTSEFEQITAAVRDTGGNDYNPGFAFVVVKKRIQTRLFAKQGNNFTNPPPGTVVDQYITKPNWYDFFLVSQSVRQGTVTPTSYNVIYDETGLQPDHIQKLTFKLTHLYFNWQGTVRVPAPCQYAHKLAFLQGQTLHREFAACLNDKLFFL